MIRHKCEDPECIYVGQPTASTCKCHRTSDQMMAARIEALEAQIQEDTTRLDEDAAIMEKATARIEALKAALRACVQYHVKAAADCRAIAAVNQDNSLGDDSLTHAIDHEIAAEDIGDIARAALAPEQDK